MASLASMVALLVVMALLFWQRSRLGLFWSAVLLFAAVGLFVAYGFHPPAPRSVVMQYLATTTIAMLLYVTSSQSALENAWAPLRALILERRRRPLLYAVLLLVPLCVATAAYAVVRPSASAPPGIRSAHPAPPTAISFKGPGQAEAVNLALGTVVNPLRAQKQANPEAYRAGVKRGKAVYYENCFYCHGDLLAGDGHYAKAIKPRPANFQDPGTIAMLQESFLFWRIAKGGPGLPLEGTPWDSVMPVWEKYLSQEDIWAVIAFLYDYTGYEPRGGAAAAEGAK